MLWQDGRPIDDAAFTKDEELDELLTAFVSREPEEVREFKKAVEIFKGNIPTIAATLRTMIVGEGKRTPPSAPGEVPSQISAAPPSIPPSCPTTQIQHILTEEIFLSIFSDTQLIEKKTTLSAS